MLFCLLYVLFCFINCLGLLFYCPCAGTGADTQAGPELIFTKTKIVELKDAPHRQHVRDASMDVPESSKQLKVTLDTFVDEFREHQEALKAHLKGNLPNELPLLPALILPASYWTSAEKDLFFHGLSVYSRLHPELIAQTIRTKTTFDVCVYLDVLAKAAELIEDDDDDENENENEDMQLGRPLIEPAMELSEEWIQHEETIAAILMEVDACPCSLEVPNEGPSSKQNEKTCTCPVNPGQHVEEERRSVKEAVIEKQNRYLNHLDPTCLTVLDWIIRERGYEGEPANDTVRQPQGLESKMGTQGQDIIIF